MAEDQAPRQLSRMALLRGRKVPHGGEDIEAARNAL
jgi:hypothetical protein